MARIQSTRRIFALVYFHAYSMLEPYKFFRVPTGHPVSVPPHHTIQISSTPVLHAHSRHISLDLSPGNGIGLVLLVSLDSLAG